MEKIVIKPDAKEIILRGKPEDGHVDVFSYNYDGNPRTQRAEQQPNGAVAVRPSSYDGSSPNGLGGLFIVGQVQPASEDTSYMINLVASLAKREYYLKPDAAPKDAFSTTLKKINEVLQDFFKNKDLDVNIGIFAVTGENIFISRLGKFKIFLARDNKNIDILNDIVLFNKDHIQEKEFSNVISGKIMPKDKIFAFYAGRSITARERNIKDNFLKLAAVEFSEKLNSIKEANDNFNCAAIHLTINKYKESAIIKSPQPRELREPEAYKEALTSPQATLAKISKTPPTKISAVKELPAVRPSEIIIKPAEPPKAEVTPASPPPSEGGNVFYPGRKGISIDEPTSSGSTPSMESPMMRPTEFSSAKKSNLLDIILKKFKPSGVYIIGVGQGPAFSKKKLIMASSLALAVVALAIISKLTFAPYLPIPGIENGKDKAITALVHQIQPKLDSAISFKDQNNYLESRKLLFESLTALSSSNVESSQKVENLRKNIMATLDELDKAVELSPNLIQQVPSNLGDSSLITSIKGKLYVYLADNQDSSNGNIVEVGSEGIGKTTAVTNFNPWYLIGGDGLLVMVNQIADKIGTLTIASGGLKTSPVSMPAAVINAYPYQGNLYMLASDGVYKITDAVGGKSNPVSWLNKDAKLPTDPLLLAVDGKIFVITKDGTLATYYKGDKTAEVSTAIPVSDDSIFLTTTDSKNLYLVDKNLNRIYVITKDSGSIVKTIKISGEPFIVSASINDSETIYLLSKDDKVWEVKPL